jgi:TetR/AcrR family transcriptional repressor of nem operon
MRYSQSHKEETRLQILKIAGRALRAKGPDGVGVAEIMKEAGLTHGGFYAHFKSKEDLLINALEGVFAAAKTKFAKAIDGLPPRHALAAYVDFYVSTMQRDNPANGCPITALNSDMPRQTKKLRAVFDAGLKRLLANMAGLIEQGGIAAGDEAGALASSIFSAMAGAVAVSRAVSDKRLSDEMLETARTSIKARLGVDDASLSRARLQ